MVMKILIVRVSSIGDVIHTLPSFFLLQRMLPQAHISWVVQEKAASLLKDQPWLDNLWVLPDKYLKPSQWGKTASTLAKIRSHSWDAIIDYQGLFKTSLLIAFLHGKTFGFASPHARSRLSCLTSTVTFTPHYTSIIEKNLSLTASVIEALAPDTAYFPTATELQHDFHLAIPAQLAAPVTDWLRAHPAPSYIALSPNTTWESKKWPTVAWQEFICQYAITEHARLIPLVLLGAQKGGQAEILAQWAHRAGQPLLVAPDWNLLQTTTFLQQATAIVGPDTGLVHLADFLGVTTMGLYGPTRLDRHGPFFSRGTHLQTPCPHYYEKKHAAGNCMNLLTPQRVLRQLLKNM